ncbi:uncharacterized protein LOC132756054 isoform X2 [Ruditapes philippinarum]|nr:uncharacterized protein LOC132756054 isoform X2 [Ruditapes philippinarum]
MDEQELYACAKVDGTTAATMLLLDRIQCRLAPSKWFVEFLRILYINGYKDIVKEMEPEFTIECEVLKQVNDIPGNHDMEQDISETTLTEYIIATRLDGFRQEIIELVSLQKIAANLSLHLLPIPVIIRLSRLSKDSNKEAMESLLEEVGKMDNPNKWSLFVTCLKESDYSYIAGILTRTSDRGTHYRERNLIKLFTPTLQHQLEPGELISHLLADNIINEKDKDEILLKYRCSGSIAASIALLDCMQCRLSPDEWYSGFLNALLNCGRNDLVNMVDPDFLHKSEYRGEILDEVNLCEPISMQSSNFRLESAYGRVLNMEHSARQQVAKLRQKYDEMENEALMEIQGVSAELINTLLETNDQLKSMASNNYAGQMKIERLLDKTLDDIHRKEFKFVPEKGFLSFPKLGSIHQTTRRRRRGPKISRDRSQSPCMVYKDRRHGNYRHRSLSSGSTQSSGFIKIDGERDQRIFSSHSNSQNAISNETVLKEYYFTRQVSVSSTSTFTNDSRSLPSSDDILNSGDYEAIKSTESHDANDIGRLESFVNFICYRTVSVSYAQNGYQLSSLCMLTTNELVMVDQNHASVILFDPIHALLKTCKMKRCFPVKVNCCENNNVFILSRRGISKYTIVMYKVHYIRTKTGKLFLHNLLPVKKIHNICNGQICSFTCSKDKVLTVCSFGHIHMFTHDGKEERVVKSKTTETKANFTWPQFCTIDKDSYAVFIYDVYSASIGKYILSSGKCIWTVDIKNGEINDLIACFGRLFISQNKSNTIMILRQDSGKLDPFFMPDENICYPLAFTCNHSQSTLLVSTYNYRRKRGNHIIRFY